MALLSVRALPGRVAYDAPRGGKRIPSDRYVSVPDTSHIRRLLNHWRDIEVEVVAKEYTPPAAPPPAAPQKAE